MRSSRGFSLIEVLIAAALLGAGVAAVISGYRSAVNVEAHQERVTTALHVAESTIEMLLLRYRDDNELQVKSTPYPATPLRFNAQGAPVADGGVFGVTWLISAGPMRGSRRLDVTVSWLDAGFMGTQTLTLTTYRN
jgi:prepilin-type N-terminal cleavage/methylation domain-containing protein